MKTIKNLIDRANLTHSLKTVPANPNYPDADEYLEHYKVTLYRAGKQMTVYYSQNVYTPKPTIDIVFEALALDASFNETAEAFEQASTMPHEELFYDLWCIPVCDQMAKTAQKLKQFLGDGYYYELISIFE